jgi:hypothetical protein
MTDKYGDRSMIYQKIYPHVHFLIQKDLDSYWSEDNHDNFRGPNDQFSTKWYWRHLYFYSLGMAYGDGPQFTLYSGGIGMGRGYDIVFNIDTLKYSLVSVDDQLSKSVVYELSDWNDMIIKIDAIFENFK